MGMSMAPMSLVSMVTYDEGMDEEPRPFDAGGISVAFDRPLNGLPVNGRLVLEGFCRWDDPERIPAPHIELILNGEVVGRQQAAKPAFALDRSALAPGPNDLQLVARLADGRSARTPLRKDPAARTAMSQIRARRSRSRTERPPTLTTEPDTSALPLPAPRWWAAGSRSSDPTSSRRCRGSTAVACPAGLPLAPCAGAMRTQVRSCPAGPRPLRPDRRNATD